jgi:hypothetical protein
MFSRWLFSRTKAAENALRDGRIDEAYDRLRDPEIAGLRGAEPLLDEVAKALAARARLHAQAGRFGHALDDLERVQKLGRETAELAALRQRVARELGRRAALEAEQKQALDRAVSDVQGGRLESGRLAVEQLGPLTEGAQVRRELDIRLARSEQLLEQAAASLRAGALLAACRYWNEAVQRQGRTRQSDALADELWPAFRAQVGSWAADGRLDLFQAALEAAGGLRQRDAQWDELERIALLARQASRELGQRDFQRAREMLLRLMAARPEAQWVKDALGEVTSILEAWSRLLASPLGLLDASLRETSEIGTDQTARPRQNTEGEDPCMEAGDAASLDGGPLLVLVDGTGSFCLSTRDVVTLGRTTGSVKVDVPLTADLQSRHAEIARIGEDYFLTALGPVRVNHRPVQRTLLRHGDRIALAAHAKLTFHKPSVKSGTAVLKLADTCRLPLDVGAVVLFHETCVLGPQGTCHVRTREGESRLVLFERAGRLFGRLDPAKGTVQERPPERARPVPAGPTLDFGDIRLTVKPYEPAAGRV